MLEHDERRRHEHGGDPDGDEQVVAPAGPAGRIFHQGKVAHDAVEGGVQHEAGEEGRHGRRRLAVGVRQPAVERREPRLRPVPDQQEDEGQLYQAGCEIRRRGAQTRPEEHLRRVEPQRLRRRRHQERPHEGEGHAHRADHQVLPGGLQDSGLTCRQMRKAVSSVVASIPTHIRPRLLETSTRLIAAVAPNQSARICGSPARTARRRPAPPRSNPRRRRSSTPGQGRGRRRDRRREHPGRASPRGHDRSGAERNPGRDARQARPPRAADRDKAEARAGRARQQAHPRQHRRQTQESPEEQSGVHHLNPSADPAGPRRCGRTRG